MDLETLSNAIIDGKVLVHSDPDEEFQHYGVLGMKWGVRKDRRRRGESDSDYRDRMARNERLAKQQLAIKGREKTQKNEAKRQIRVIREEAKAQRKREKQLLKSKDREQERTQSVERERIKVDKKKSKTNRGVKVMSDQELMDAIVRLQREQQYKNLKKGPARKTVDFGMSITSGIVKKLATDYGTAYAKKKLNARFPDLDELLNGDKKKKKKDDD